MNVFVNRLNELIKEKGITRYKLAKDLNVNKQTVIFWADGINEPKISYLVQLAKYFDVSADYLLGLTDV
jgi:transcriptional regulator with XRE-family HTH domain